MKRSVAAWCVLWKGQTLMPSTTRSARHLVSTQVRVCWGPNAKEPSVVPVTITYDDATPPRRRKSSKPRRKGRR